jgi:hypothetical protein
MGRNADDLDLKPGQPTPVGTVIRAGLHSAARYPVGQ